jgi:hypothetical protein
LKLDAIPAELRAIPRWLLWRYVKREGKRTKPPFQANGRKASVTDPATWTTYEEAREALSNGGGYEGLGLVLAGDGLVAWDLDHCLDPRTLEITDPKIAALVRKLDSYTEITPSGEGLRVFVRAKLPRSGAKKGNVEAYADDRYVTVTGNRLPGTPAEIRERAAETLEAFAAEFDRAPEPPVAPQSEVARLLAGLPPGRDDSADDLRAAILLAQRLPDPAVIDAAIRGSKRYRAKWDELHGAETYGARTIRLALSKVAPPSDEIIVIDEDEFMRLEFPPREYLLEPWLQQKNLVMIYGPRGVGKTLLAVGAALAAANGGAFLRWRAPRPLRVLYVDGELPRETLKARLRDVARTAGLEHTNRLGLVTPDQQPSNRLPNLATPEGQAAFGRIIELRDPELVVWDNMSTLVRSGEENNAESWQIMQDWYVLLRSRGITNLILHHAGKTGDQRGTSKREDVLDVTIRVAKPNNYRPEEGARFEVSFTKARDVWGRAVEAFEAWMTDAWTVRPLQMATEERILALLAQRVPVKTIAAEVGVTLSWVYQVKKAAQKSLFTEER